MKQFWFVIMLAMLMLSACGKKNEVDTEVSKAPSIADRTEQPKQSVMEGQVSAQVSEVPSSTAVTPSLRVPPETKKSETPQSGSALNHDEGLALAGKSGCLACHQIDTKLVGPAWRDVSKRYKGDSGAKARLVEKVKMGGKGNWTQVTGGIPMPPNSPRVSDENIKKLVTFVLSLE